MSGVVCERLAGCNSESLDAYLRGVGFFLLAGRVDSLVRAWWDEDGILNFVSRGVDPIARAIAEDVLSGGRLITPVQTPWRGSTGRSRSFVELRNAADEDELDWFDACALPRVEELGQRRRGAAERSERENNPLLGQGGGFGRSEIAAAHEDALSKLRGSGLSPAELADVLVSLLCHRSINDAVTRKLSTDRAVLGAYQSGRATGPGLSSRDVEPTRQTSRTNAWDVVLVIEGLRAFRGIPTRRPEPTARVQGSFPLVARARPVATGPGEVVEGREDPADTFEFFAPLWSQPCSPRVFRHLLGTARLRTARGVARDTLDAVLVQAAKAARGLGFDRLVRFAFIPGSDPRYRYAVRRGSVRARGLRGAATALEEIVPFLGHLERTVPQEVREKRTALSMARRRLEDALAALGVERPAVPPDRLLQARQVQDVLIALALMQPVAARVFRARASRQDLAAPSLSPRWLHLADDGSPEYRLARALVSGLAVGPVSVLRRTLLPQREREGLWVLDSDAAVPDLERVGNPLETLVRLALLAVRRRDRNVPLVRLGQARMGDVALLLSGTLGSEGERRLLLLAAALAGIRLAGGVEPLESDDALRAGIGADPARLMLAAQAADEEVAEAAWVERAELLASLLLAGRCDAARVAADRELRRRGLELLPQPPLGSPPPGKLSHLALAVLLPFGSQQRQILAGVVSVMSIPMLEGGVR
jgi:CRISPR-associated protein Csx17